jgi:hypothetical protein
MNNKINSILELYYKIGPNFVENIDKEEVFKIYLLILKENEKINDNNIDMRSKIILSYLNPVYKNKLKDIKYVNKGIDLDDKNTIEYKESDSRLYLFDKKDMEDIKKYQINPYSARVISKNFFNKYFPNIDYVGNNIEKICTEISNNNSDSNGKFLSYTESYYKVYIFDEKDIEYIKKYQINPYSKNKMEKSFFDDFLPDIVYNETDYIDPTAKTIYSNPVNKKLNIVYNWINMFKKNYENFLYHRYITCFHKVSNKFLKN